MSIKIKVSAPQGAGATVVAHIIKNALADHGIVADMRNVEDGNISPKILKQAAQAINMNNDTVVVQRHETDDFE